MKVDLRGLHTCVTVVDLRRANGGALLMKPPERWQAHVAIGQANVPHPGASLRLLSSRNHVGGRSQRLALNKGCSEALLVTDVCIARKARCIVRYGSIYYKLLVSISWL